MKKIFNEIQSDMKSYSHKCVTNYTIHFSFSNFQFKNNSKKRYTNVLPIENVFRIIETVVTYKLRKFIILNGR